MSGGRWLKFLCILALMPLGWQPAPVVAQPSSCVDEVEPNNDPGTANAFTSVASCVKGSIGDGDQDFFAWKLGKKNATRRWSFSMTGIPQQAVIVQIMTVKFAADGTTIESFSKIAEFKSPVLGEPAKAEDLIFPPGAYFVAAGASAAGNYELTIAQGKRLPKSSDAEPNDDVQTASPLSGEFSTASDLQDSEDWYAWSIDEANAEHDWTLTLQGLVTNPPSLELMDQSGAVILANTKAERNGALTLEDVGLDAGTYFLHVSPSQPGATPYVLSAVAASLRKLNQEEEPNDQFASASHFDPTKTFHGRLTVGQETDYLAFKVDDTLAAKLFDLKLIWKQAGLSRRLCLFDAQQQQLICKDGDQGIAMKNLRLPAGDVYVLISGEAAPDDPYLLRFDSTSAFDPTFESEPNDILETATPLDVSTSMSGRLTPQDSDFYQFTVTGEPQLWSIELKGITDGDISLWNPAGAELQSARPGENGDPVVATLWDMFLVPGAHLLRVAGNHGDYSITMTALGPPDPNGEREPNEDPSRAHVLELGQTRTGRIPSPTDIDAYRFFLAGPEHVRLAVDAPADAALGLRLMWGSVTGTQITQQTAEQPGAPIIYDAYLQPGDYGLFLSTAQSSTTPYSVRLEREDPFNLPVDREPNDQVSQAAPLPKDLTVHGWAANNGELDCYSVPAQTTGGTVTVALQGNIQPSLFDGATNLALTPDSSLTTYQAPIPAEKPLSLCVLGSGDYAFSLAFNGQPAMPALGAPESAGLDTVALTLTPKQKAVAPYWTEGQRVDADLVVTNNGDSLAKLTLQTATSDLTWTAELGETAISVDPNESTTVPVTIKVLPDARGGPPVRITVAATDEDGNLTTGWTDIDVDRDAPPVNPEQAWSVPNELLGGFNVAALSLGAVPISASDGQGPEVIGRLFDGAALPDLGFSTSSVTLPATITVQLAGDKALPIAGVVLNPEPLGVLSRYSGVDEIRDFEILLSTDGTTFTSAFKGVLSPRVMPQSFVFDKPVKASFAQLIIYSTYGGGAGNSAVLAEWEVIAQPGAVPGGVGPFNIADPKFGGHYVRSDPNIVHLPVATQMLQDDPERVTGRAAAGVRPSFTIAFLHDRAARFSVIQWVDPTGSQPDARFNTVEIAVSTESPNGPWVNAGTWTLDRAQTGEGQPISFKLKKPVWARFVRFTSQQSVGEGGQEWEFPAVVRVVEQKTRGDYLSILGEWGLNSPRGIYERIEQPEEIAFGPEGTSNDNRNQAQLLPLGETARGSAQVGKDVDWYQVTIPKGMDQLELTVTGRPAVDVDVHLQDELGADVPISATPAGPDVTVLRAPVQANQTYFLKVEQPPHSVVFSFDTSASIANFDTQVYAALNQFASEVVPGQEAVDFLPFGRELLIGQWEDQPFLLQQSLNDYPRDAFSSDSPAAIGTATEALSGQPGAKAIMVITDAESGMSYAGETWEKLDATRPRIFTVQIASLDDKFPMQRGLMEDWALVNTGYYVYASSQGDIDIAFDRVATWLRRPAAYTLTAEAVVAPTPTPTPASTPEPTATPAKPGQIQVLPPKRATGEPVLVAEHVAVEIVLDTSGSMLQPLEGSTRADVARSTLIDLVTNTIPAGTPLALRVFGNSPDSCETSLAVPLQPLDPGAMSNTINGIQFVNLVKTPIGDSLKQVANDLKDVNGPKIIVLVTDGEETCGGDPEAAINELVSQGIDVHVNIVGFALDDQALKATFERWAQIGQGVYIDAANAEELSAAVDAAVQAPFRVVDAKGDVVATGVVGGGSVSVPPGTYTIEVLTDPERRVEGVEVQSGKRATVQLE